VTSVVGLGKFWKKNFGTCPQTFFSGMSGEATKGQWLATLEEGGSNKTVTAETIVRWYNNSKM